MSVRRLDVEPGVVRLQASSWRGRAVGYDVSAWLLDDVLVDTCFPDVHAEVLDAVKAMRPRGVVLTHWHEDHAGNGPSLADARLPIVAHPLCLATLEARPPIRAYRQIVWGRTPTLRTDILPFEPAPLHVIETPGHTADHVVVWNSDRRIVASGDLFLGVKVRVAHAHESLSTLLASLRTVAALEPRLLLDAHRGPVSNATAMLNAKIAFMEETIGAICALGDRGVPANEIRRRVLGQEPVVGWASRGEYSKAAFVRVALREAGLPAA